MKIFRSASSFSQLVSKKTACIIVRIPASELGFRSGIGLSCFSPAASTSTSFSTGIRCAPPEISAAYSPQIHPPSDSPTRLAFSTFSCRNNSFRKSTYVWML